MKKYLVTIKDKHGDIREDVIKALDLVQLFRDFYYWHPTDKIIDYKVINPKTKKEN